MPERPLLILPAPSEPSRRPKKSGGGANLHVPSHNRQIERITPLLTSLQQAFNDRKARIHTEAAGLTPEDVIVLETAGSVDDFMVAVRGIPGLEWLGEIEEEDIPPDDDFFVPASDGTTPRDKKLRGRVFLVFTNQQALQQMLSLWASWKQGRRLPHGLGKWGDVFSMLMDVRLWGVRDRLEETGILDDWRERSESNQEVIPCEIEMWFRGSAQRRQAARSRVAALVTALQGQVLHETLIEEIYYHALLVKLPLVAVQQLITHAGRDTALVQCEQVQFFRATGQMSALVVDDVHTPDTGYEPVAGRLGEPVVALFDGFPLQNHSRLNGRIIVDDPDNVESQYPSVERRHGTAMASLIIHGDLNAVQSPLKRLLYLRPILRPDSRAWRSPRPETAPEDQLIVDLVHRAVRRLFEESNGEPAVAPQVCVVNLSIGIRDRLFEGALSPLARLLDWLAWKYSVLFVVSAGNHPHEIELGVPRDKVSGLSPQEIQSHVIRSIAADARHRRLLSPSEAINVLTVGAVHHDSSPPTPVQRAVQPLVNQGFPSIINAQGMGYKRSIKPDILLPGGRIILLESPRTATNATFDIYAQGLPPGQRVACPGATPGDVTASFYTRGTSNATALASRFASQIYDVLDELRQQQGGELVDDIPRSLWIKALLVHAANWGTAGSLLEQLLKTPQNSRQFKEYVTRLLGYGIVDDSRIGECTSCRVTALGGGQLQADQAHIHRLPLPPSLSGQRGLRRLVITLAWYTPVNVAHQSWRRAALWFKSPSSPLSVDRQQASWQAVQRGTVQHEILEGDQADAFIDGETVDVLVSSRADAGALEDAVPYSLAVTLEIADQIGIDIYNEIRVRVQPTRVSITPGTLP